MSGQEWSVVVTLAGAVLALVGVLVGGLLAAFAQRWHWRFSEQADACAGFLSEYAKVYLSYTKAVSSGSAAGLRSTTTFVEWAEFNQALEVLHLMAAKEIVDAAHDLDRVLWEVGIKITRESLAKDDWAAARVPLDEARLDFVNVVRRNLGKGKEPLSQLNGRPSDDDPIWAGKP